MNWQTHDIDQASHSPPFYFPHNFFFLLSSSFFLEQGAHHRWFRVG
jgi:hypothetical protein